jgi:hypothetical protein
MQLVFIIMGLFLIDRTLKVVVLLIMRMNLEGNFLYLKYAHLFYL